MKKIILITGGCGFIGSNLSEYLHKKNYKIIVIDDLSIGNIKNLFSLKKIQFIKKDILNIDKVKILPKKRREQVNVVKDSVLSMPKLVKQMLV